MINDLTDLEPLLAQYDPGKVLIGPLLNLSINSSFRFFYIAGNGPKIYESISVGFVELETDAQKQRADIVATLESRFGEVQILGSQLELAQAVHSLWPNEETTRFLGTSALEAKLQPKGLAGREEGFDNGSDVGEPFSDRGQQVVEKTVPELARPCRRYRSQLDECTAIAPRSGAADGGPPPWTAKVARRQSELAAQLRSHRDTAATPCGTQTRRHCFGSFGIEVITGNCREAAR